MPEGVRADGTGDVRLLSRLADNRLQSAFISVVTPNDTEAEIGGEPVGEKDTLPSPCVIGVGVRCGQHVGQGDAAGAVGQIVLASGRHGSGDRAERG